MGEEACMGSREESRRVRGAVAEIGRPERPAGGAAVVEPLVAGFQKCPYLAGRPPCGTHSLFPSGNNVCWAESGDDKPYRGINRNTQSACCFRGPDGPAGCGRYQRAVAEARPLPRFESRLPSASSAPESIAVPHPPPNTVRFVRLAAWLIPLCLTALLLLLMLR
jgi:hypothetical protein